MLRKLVHDKAKYNFRHEKEKKSNNKLTLFWISLEHFLQKDRHELKPIIGLSDKLNVCEGPIVKWLTMNWLLKVWKNKDHNRWSKSKFMQKQYSTLK